MCLSHIDNPTKTTIKKGYKAFFINRNAKVVVHNMFRFGEYRVGRTYHDKSHGIIYIDHSRTRGYPTGYHIYTRKQDAIDFAKSYYTWREEMEHVIHKVTFDNIVASGMERFKKVVVAKTMTIGERLDIGNIHHTCLGNHY